MKKSFLKSFAMVTMLLCALTASAVDWSAYSWLGSTDPAAANKYKIDLPTSGAAPMAVNIQHPGFSPEIGIYCTFPAGISNVSVPSKIDGAGVVLFLSSFSAKETEVTVDYATGSSTFHVYYEDGDAGVINFALAANGATATATSGNASAAIDGNEGTRWESAQSDPQSFCVNFGQSREFNTVQILWEGAYGKSFTIEYSADSTSWSNFATVTDQSLSGFPYLQTLQVATAVTAQYVRFNGTTRGTTYGYSFWEFSVLMAQEHNLTTLDIKPAGEIVKLGDSLALTVTAKDQNNILMTEYGDITYTVSPADAGTVVNNVFQPAKSGLATISATVDSVSAPSFSVFTYEGNNVALSTDINTDNKVIAQSTFTPGGTDAYYAVDGNEGSVYQGSSTNGTAADEASRTFDSWFVLDLGAYYNVNLITIKFEGACSDAYHVDASLNGTDWVVMYNFAQTMGVNGHTDYIYGSNLANSQNIRFVRFYSTKASTQWGMKIFEMQVFATPGQAPADTEAPVLTSAVLQSVSNSSAVIAVSATDNVAVASYKVVDAANSFSTTAVASEGKITVSGLLSNTTYNFSVTALDLVGNESNAIIVAATTPVYNPEPTVAAPVPTHAATHVVSIYSDAYTPAYTSINSFNEPWWRQPSLEEKAIEGNNYLRYSGDMGGCIGWQFAPVDASAMTHLHLDIWPSVTGQITVIPIYGGEGLTTSDQRIVLDVVQEQWNSFDIDLSEYPALDLSSIFQIKFDQYSTQTEFSVDNFYFYNNGTTTLLESTENSVKPVKCIENNQIVIIRDGVRYDLMGRILR